MKIYMEGQKTHFQEKEVSILFIARTERDTVAVRRLSIKYGIIFVVIKFLLKIYVKVILFNKRASNKIEDYKN
ncbi:hypothetical protein TXIAM_30264 [Tenacibaculum xiamenense]